LEQTVDNQRGHPNIQGAPKCVCKNHFKIVFVNGGIIGKIIDTIDDETINEAKDAWVKRGCLDGPALIHGDKKSDQDPHDNPTPHTENKFFLDVMKQGFVDRWD
jgi:hypothetical protein